MHRCLLTHRPTALVGTKYRFAGQLLLYNETCGAVRPAESPNYHGLLHVHGCLWLYSLGSSIPSLGTKEIP